MNKPFLVAALAISLHSSPSWGDLGDIELPCLVPGSWMQERHFRPQCSGVGRYGFASAPMKFNKLGLRDRDYDKFPGKNTLRVLLLGSTKTLGVGLNEEDTLARVLETELRKISKRKIEIINGTVSGWCTWQTSFHLKKYLEEYNPHLVLFNIEFPTCLVFDAAWRERVVFSEDKTPLGFDVSLVGIDSKWNFLNQWYFKSEYFRLLYILNDSFRRLITTWRIQLFSRESSDKELAQSTLSALDTMARISRDHGAAFLSWIHEGKEPMEDQHIPSRTYVRVGKFFADLQPPVIYREKEILSVILGHPTPVVHLGDFNYHEHLLDRCLTKEGMGLWAGELARAVAKFATSSKELASKWNR